MLCETVSFQSSCFTLQCSDCYVICFMLRCDGDVKGIGENRKLLKEKNVGKILSFLNLIFGMSFYFLEGSLSFVKIQSKIKSKTCVSSIVPLSQSTRSSAVLLLSQSHTATYQLIIVLRLQGDASIFSYIYEDISFIKSVMSMIFRLVCSTGSVVVQKILKFDPIIDQ